MCVLHLDVLLLFSQQNDWNVPVFWLVMASRKREPHSKPCWQCRVCTCIALPDSRNPCCLLEVKSKIISGHCQCGQSFLFLCAAVQDLCSFQKKIQCQRLWEVLHWPMSALVTMWAAVVPSLKGKRAERAFLLSNLWMYWAVCYKKGSTQVI